VHRKTTTFVVMARFLRAALLKSALGVALATLAAVSPAAAATGGAAPSAPSGSASGGASEAAAAAAGAGAGSAAGGATAGSAAAGGASAGGAAAGATPPSGASSGRTGGAAAGARPPKRAVPKRSVRRQARRAPSRRAAPRRSASRRGAAAPLVPDPGTVAGTFPVAGSGWTFGGEGARFGAGRPGHVHQGQDVAAPSGTPLVAPVAGTVTWKANQPKGAGIYVVVRGSADGRDYVFMHLKRGSVVVAPGQTVAAGDPLAQVGSTGASSGPHLHFEIWVGGWQADGGAPIDPLPQLQRWAAGAT